MGAKRLRTGWLMLAMAGLAVVVIGVGVIERRAGREAGGLVSGQLSAAGDAYGYRVYVPSSLRDGRAVALVVVLHGCNTTAAQQAAVSGYDAIAERRRFVVLYPDVDPIDDARGRCWKGIWDPAAEGRGRGDAGAIAEMTSMAIQRWHVDSTRVYAIGISAGAFETSILGAVYPDRYAAIGIHSGAAYRGAEIGCLASQASPADTRALARAALAAMGPRARVMPVIVFHGDADGTVPYRCGREALAQWLRTDGLVLAGAPGRARRAPVPSAPGVLTDGAVPGGRRYTVASYADPKGCLVAQLWTVHGMGHYWSGGSGDAAVARYSDPRGPSAAASSWAFFTRWRTSGPAEPCGRPG